EATRMGFPPKAWFAYDVMGAGALPLVSSAVDRMDPAYYTDFWTRPGYLGADPNGSAVRDRFRFASEAAGVILPGKAFHTEGMGVDEAWQADVYRYEGDPVIVMRDAPGPVQYSEGLQLAVTSGQLAGYRLPVARLEGSRCVIGTPWGLGDVADKIKLIQPGDGLLLDNSNYLALQTYHRHQVPGRDYAGWEQFRGEDGTPIYPQRKVITGPLIAYSAGGAVQSGRIHGKMIVVACLMDEAALPWQADWYANKVREHLGEEADDRFRLWYIENALHGSVPAYGKESLLHAVSYRGALNQALLDISDWVERGVVPPAGSAYRVTDAQVVVPETAEERRGIQPVVNLSANGAVRAVVKAGEPVFLEGVITLPPGAGAVTSAAFDLDGSADFAVRAAVETEDEGRSTRVRLTHSYDQPGTYFPVLRVTSNRQGSADDIYTQVRNLARVRVVVKD
ncbi:MAG: hypothetical protein ACYC6L_03875, partial [Anaerolineae bacterium]